MVAGPPQHDVSVPACVRMLAGGQPFRVVWQNELGGLTFAIAGDPGRYVKWVPAGSGIDLRAEESRLRWAVGFTTVARILDSGHDDDGSWLATTALPGENAVSDRWKADPVSAVTAIGRGLREMHDALPVEGCPFTWSVQDRLAQIIAEAHAGRREPTGWSSDFPGLTLRQAFDVLNDPPGVDRMVVCHGDACAPNTLIGDDGNCVGHVDVGVLGVADRWADLAVATWSTIWNYGPGLQETLRKAYGIGDDAERTRYYRLLWALGP